MLYSLAVLNFTMKKSSLFIILFFVVIPSIPAQSIVGSWKCLSNVLVNADGTKQDLWKNITEAFACAADMQYVFDANGTHYIKADAACANIAKIGTATWKVKDKIITLTTKDTKNTISTTYMLGFAGKVLTLTHIYTAEEKVQLNIQTQKIVIIYQKN
jgi:Domain of unknown function (DUF5004)